MHLFGLSAPPSPFLGSLHPIKSPSGAACPHAPQPGSRAGTRVVTSQCLCPAQGWCLQAEPLRPRPSRLPINPPCPRASVSLRECSMLGVNAGVWPHLGGPVWDGGGYGDTSPLATSHWHHQPGHHSNARMVPAVARLPASSIPPILKLGRWSPRYRWQLGTGGGGTDRTPSPWWGRGSVWGRSHGAGGVGQPCGAGGGGGRGQGQWGHCAPRRRGLNGAGGAQRRFDEALR